MGEPAEPVKKWPIVYSVKYNVNFFGLEKLHPFDACKWKNVFEFIKTNFHIEEEDITSPDEITPNELLRVHTKRYLKSLKWGWNVAAITEVPFLVLLPNFLIQKCYLRPMRYQTGGSILAARLALSKGWAVNIGGGFHHCSKDRGGGFCPYADITLLVENVLSDEKTGVKKVMIVDLDAHQGNGYEHDFLGNPSVFIMDVYNVRIYPHDSKAKKAITCNVELMCYTEDQEYLDKVERNLESSLSKFYPDLLVYNAGTDILVGDPLGCLSISPQGVIRRDELVFIKARERRIPIVMLTSGGYTRQSANIIAESIINLRELGLIDLS